MDKVLAFLKRTIEDGNDHQFRIALNAEGDGYIHELGVDSETVMFTVAPPPNEMICERTGCSDIARGRYKRKIEDEKPGWEDEPIYLCPVHSSDYTKKEFTMSDFFDGVRGITLDARDWWDRLCSTKENERLIAKHQITHPLTDEKIVIMYIAETTPAKQ